MADTLDRREFLKKASLGSLGFAGAMGLAGLQTCAPRAKATGQPNILVILADDMGYSDIGCYGSEIRTPHLDRLAAGGLRFTDFYNQARCCPTRACLLTGLYPHQAGVGHMLSDRGLDGYRGDLNLSCVTLAEVLKSAGYSTYMSGKWHVTRFLEGPDHNWPLRRGFDRFFGTITGAGSYFAPSFLFEDDRPIEAPPGEWYYTDAITDHAVTFLRDHDSPAPFFLYTAFTAPHWPLHAREQDIAPYKGRYDAGWDALREERYRRMIELGLIDPRWELTPRDPRVPPWENAEYPSWQARRMEVYAAQVDRMDQGIGRILAELERQGRMEDTLIFFLSDNGGCAEELTESWQPWLTEGLEKVAPRKTRDGGPMTYLNRPDVAPGPENTYQSYGIPWANVSNTPFRLYKHWVHQGGTAAPLIVHWPRRIKSGGELRRQSAHLIDLMATCVDVSGAVYPAEFKGHAVKPMEGVSLVPAFDGKSLEREALFFEHERNRAVIAGKWKLVARDEEGPWELYDLEADKTEMHDLAAEFPARVESLAAMWQTWAERVGAIPWE